MWAVHGLLCAALRRSICAPMSSAHAYGGPCLWTDCGNPVVQWPYHWMATPVSVRVFGICIWGFSPVQWVQHNTGNNPYCCVES